MWVQLSTTCSNLVKYPNGELLVTVDHNQLLTMASETVDPINWSHPPPYTGQYPLSSTYYTVQWGANHKICCTQWAANVRPSVCQANALPVQPLKAYNDWSSVAPDDFRSDIRSRCLIVIFDWRQLLKEAYHMCSLILSSISVCNICRTVLMNTTMWLPMTKFNRHHKRHFLINFITLMCKPLKVWRDVNFKTSSPVWPLWHYIWPLSYAAFSRRYVWPLSCYLLQETLRLTAVLRPPSGVVTFDRCLAPAFRRRYV